MKFSFTTLSLVLAIAAVYAQEPTTIKITGVLPEGVDPSTFHVAASSSASAIASAASSVESAAAAAASSFASAASSLSSSVASVAHTATAAAGAATGLHVDGVLLGACAGVMAALL